MPEIVRKAILILWGTMVIGVVQSAMDFSRLAQQKISLGPWWLVTLVTFALMALNIYLIEQRKNWARWLYAVMCVIGILSSINPLIQSLQHDLIYGIIGLSQLTAQIVVIFLLFSAPAKAWFKKQPQQFTS